MCQSHKSLGKNKTVNFFFFVSIRASSLWAGDNVKAKSSRGAYAAKAPTIGSKSCHFEDFICGWMGVKGTHKHEMVGFIFPK